MEIALGVFITLISLIGWIGQTITTFSPKIAAKLGVTETESDVDPTFYADVRGEAIWDTIILWTLPVAGILLMMGSTLWPYFGLIGGGMYLYFAGRGVVVRLIMQRRKIAIGRPETLKVNYIFLFLCGVISILALIMAVLALPL